MDDWIAAEKSDGRLRVWRVAGNGRVTARNADPAGTDPLAALERLTGAWRADGRALPVVAAGLGGGTRPVPCAPLGAPTEEGAAMLRLVPGLSQATPPDLTRGAEIRIAGYLAGDPDFDGVLCIAGGRSLWARVSAGEVVSFQSFLTGRLLSALTPAEAGTDPDAETFSAALEATLARPAGLAAALSSELAAAEIAGRGPSRAALAGALIGAELAAARPYWLGQAVTVIGDAPHVARYCVALAAQGAAPGRAEGAAMALAGLIAARGHGGA